MNLGLTGLAFLSARDRPLAQQADDAAQVFRAASRLGYAYVSFAQHLISYPYFWPQPFPMVARMAPEVGQMRIVVQALLLPYFNAVDVAEQVATLDHICKGRFDLVAGLGYRDVELEAVGIQMRDRVPREIEAIGLMRRLWSGEEVTFHGRYFHVTRGRMGITPIQKPAPPIWITCHSPGAAARAGRIGDGVFFSPFVGWKDALKLRDIYLAEARKAGRPPRLAASRFLALGKDPDSAVQQCASALEAQIAMYRGWNMQEPTMVKLRWSLEEPAADFVVAGNHDQCRETLARYRDEVGISHVTLAPLNMPVTLAERLEYIQAVAEGIVRLLA